MTADTIVSSTLSTMSCRPTRMRPAPSARRVASSLMRAREQTSTRFATFTHPMRSTNSAPPHIRYSVPLMSRLLDAGARLEARDVLKVIAVPLRIRLLLVGERERPPQHHVRIEEVEA